MTLRAFVIATTSIAVAIMLSVIVPIAELRIADEQPTCCCPNPVICKCKGDPSAPCMRVCHSTRTDLARAELPAFTPPIIQVVERTEQPVDVVSAALPSPHPAPAPARPDAPS